MVSLRGLVGGVQGSGQFKRASKVHGLLRGWGLGKGVCFRMVLEMMQVGAAYKDNMLGLLLMPTKKQKGGLAAVSFIDCIPYF